MYFKHDDCVLLRQQQCYVFIYPLILSGFGFGYNTTAGPVWYANENGNGKCNTFDDLPAISLSSFATRGMTWYRGFSGFVFFLSFSPVHPFHVLAFAYMYTWADDFCASYVVGNFCTVSVDMEY